MSKTFLRAEWRKLALANYAISPEVLQPYVPKHTELDLWNGTCYVSLVGFMFLRTRVLGVPVPFYTHFEEVNLRFYVKHWDGTAFRRGVVFIKEIVPKSAITWVANTLYKENYATMPMRHLWQTTSDGLEVGYEWKCKGKWQVFDLVTDTVPEPLEVGSEAEFITEHYWGYTQISPTRTSEYGVEHPRWDIYYPRGYAITVDFGAVYGKAFAGLTHTEPLSVFLAEGSEIAVKKGRFL